MGDSPFLISYECFPYSFDLFLVFFLVACGSGFFVLYIGILSNKLLRH